MKKIIENNKCLYFLKELLKYKKEIGILSISTIVSTVTVFLQPLLIKQITDIGILEKNMPQIVNGVAGLFVCVLVYLMIEVVQAKTFAEIHNSFYKNLYCNVFRKLLHLKKHYFQMKNSMEIVQMLQCDVSQVASMTDRYVVMSFSYVFRVISGLAGLMLLSPELLCIVVIVIPVKYVLVKCLAKKREKNMKMYIQVEQQFGGWLGDTINTVEEIKLWNLYELRKLEFKNVRFQYTKDREVLKKVSFKLEPGEKVAIIGKNGSGKSTILELLLRFYEPEEGEILCNGENIKVLKLSEYRSLFSVVSQKSALFLGDIVQNIDLEGKADRQKLNEVLRKSGVKKYLQRFPEKEKTQIGDDGAFLSGGERQKLVVARALLKDAPVMLFDEASSGFDVEANEYLYKIITEEMPEKSVIFITHHYDKLEKFDKVYLVKDGFLTEVRTGKM